MKSIDELYKDLEKVRSAYIDVKVSFEMKDDYRNNDKKLNSKINGLDLELLRLKAECLQEAMVKELADIERRLSTDQLKEELIKRLAEVEAREEMVENRESRVTSREELVNERLDKLRDYYDDCIEIATKEVTKVKNEMVTVYCEKLEEVEELLEVVRATDTPQFQIELFEQLREVSPFTYKVKSTVNFVEVPKSDSNTTRTKKVTELDSRSSELDKRENELAIEAARLEELRQQLMSASTKRQAATRSKYKLEEVPAYKARANELKAERSLPWKEWTKTDAGREYLRLSSAVRRLEKSLN